MKNEYKSVNRPASKKQAINLIKNALKNGFTREVTAQRIFEDRRPFAVTVFLRKDSGSSDYAFIWISFRIGTEYRKSSVAITTRNSYSKVSHKGLWNAQYEVQRLKD